MSTSNPWKTLAERQQFDCPHFTVRTDTVSHRGRAPRAYNSIRVKAHGVTILPIAADGSTVLVGQYRYVLGGYSWELPGGGAPGVAQALDSARDELSEETGLTADRWLKIVEVPVAPGTTDEVINGFVVWGLTEGKPHPDVEEELAKKRLPFADVVQMALDGKIGDICSVATILSLQVRLGQDRLPQDLLTLLKPG